MRIISTLVTLLLIILSLTFAFMNAETVTLHYYTGSTRIALPFLLALTLGLGILLGFLASFKSILSLKKKNYQLKHRIKLLEQEAVKTAEGS